MWGDFENSLRPNPHSFISIQCASCNGGLGIELAQREVAYTGGLQFFNFTLNEETKFGWRKNPRDSRISEWPNPTQCEFLQVLISMDRIDIMGDFTDGYETIALDQPQFLIGDGNFKLVNLFIYIQKKQFLIWLSVGKYPEIFRTKVCKSMPVVFCYQSGNFWISAILRRQMHHFSKLFYFDTFHIPYEMLPCFLSCFTALRLKWEWFWNAKIFCTGVQ